MRKWERKERGRKGGTVKRDGVNLTWEDNTKFKVHRN